MVTAERRKELWEKLKGDGRGQNPSEWQEIEAGFHMGFHTGLKEAANAIEQAANTGKFHTPQSALLWVADALRRDAGK